MKLLFLLFWVLVCLAEWRASGGSLTNHQLQYDGTTWTTKSNMPVTVESPNAGGEGL